MHACMHEYIYLRVIHMNTQTHTRMFTLYYTVRTYVDRFIDRQIISPVDAHTHALSESPSIPIVVSRSARFRSRSPPQTDRRARADKRAAFGAALEAAAAWELCATGLGVSTIYVHSLSIDSHPFSFMFIIVCNFMLFSKNCMKMNMCGRAGLNIPPAPPTPRNG